MVTLSHSSEQHAQKVHSHMCVLNEALRLGVQILQVIGVQLEQTLLRGHENKFCRKALSSIESLAARAGAMASVDD